MSSNKAALKAAKTAIDEQRWTDAVTQSRIVLSSDSSNYFAKLFLGRAQEKQGQYDEAARTYRSGVKLKPDDSQAWLGLCSVFEAQGSKHVDEYLNSAVEVAKIYGSTDDAHRCQSTIDKLQSFVKQDGNSAQIKRALQVLLPSSPVYSFLEGRIPHPSNTYVRLAEITEEEESQKIKTEINERRTRLGAGGIGQVTTAVRQEIFGQSDLEGLYQEVIDWSNDDEVRRQYEEKLLQRAYDSLLLLPSEQKTSKLDQVLTLAEGMVIIHHPFQLAWDLVLETRDLDSLQDLDANILREYVAVFPVSGVGKVLRAWLSSELSPFPALAKSEDANAEQPEPPMSAEDRLVAMTEGLSKAEQSPFVHRLVGDYFLHLEEHQTAAETARSGARVLSMESAKLGMSLQNTRDALDSVLATALVHYQAPRNHAEARRLFEDILQRKPKLTPALIGLGLIFEETQDYRDAISFLQQALNEDSTNVEVGTELAWCKALSGEYATALQELESYLPTMKIDDPKARDLRAQVLYRTGICIWELDDSKAARKDRNGAYDRFLQAIKTNVNFAPAYTSLGLYYEQYAKDKKRARQCFQKAFELSSAETDAAERLARSFANQGEWEIVEVIAQRVIDSGRARPPPGSKRKGLSWPYSALGVVQMNRQDYQQAIVAFLAALRISPDDYQSYVGLGESYHNSGRYNSASRTFNYALEPHDGMQLMVIGETWFSKYMLANVHRELGEHEEAITGLQQVLDERPSEFGVLMSLLQTFVERSASCVEIGLFGQAIDNANDALATAGKIVADRPKAFNVWKAIGDACMTFSIVQSAIEDFPKSQVSKLLHTNSDHAANERLSDLDRVTLSSLDGNMVNGESAREKISTPLVAGILAYKRAIVACAHDRHAQAVAWYNLGWAEHRAYTDSSIKQGRKYLRAAMRCFKRAIELEAGNYEFWNALGVATTTLNSKVAQHSFVRSLHLNELNAKVWTNLGVLYMVQNDHELAHQAFGRAQSTDPTYAHAWVGEGIIALLLDDAREALNHFTHAFEISGSGSLVTKRQYATSSFDHLLVSPAASNDLTALIQPLFALEQLQSQTPNDLPYRHLAALFLERVGKYSAASEALEGLCNAAEGEYEASESLTALARFAFAKCDLARCQLAAHDYESAAENAKTALDLSADADNSGLDADARRKLRLSAHLSAGLASFNLQNTSEAINMFRSALHESGNNPDVVCLLVKVLWAQGGSEEKSVAREQLFECVEKHPEHVSAVTLLGAIAALDDDADTTSAVKEDLISLRTKDGLTLHERDEIEIVLSALAGLEAGASGEEAALTEAQSAIMFKPDHAQAWTELAQVTGQEQPAKMALETASKTVPPLGSMEAENLAQAFAGVGTIGDAQRAVVLAPWEAQSWQAMGDALHD